MLNAISKVCPDLYHRPVDHKGVRRVVLWAGGAVASLALIVFVVVPIVGPILLQMDISPVWFGVMIAINLQTSFLTPPFGFALFYLKGIAPKEIKIQSIYKGIIPFVLLQLLGLMVVMWKPNIALWLMKAVYD
jgi:TRAP-type mannitol/chloroaromatic compound transport system permease large subunit